MTERSRQTTNHAPSAEIDRLEDIDWNFEGAHTQAYTHGLHAYPARMIPQIPETLLVYFMQEGIIQPGDTLYDPFAGSGTSLVEARRAGLHGEANDINPLACLVTLAKARPLELEVLEASHRTLFDGLSQRLEQIRNDFHTDSLSLDAPNIREGWFPEPQLSELITIRERIFDLQQDLRTSTSIPEGSIEEVIRFLQVSLSSITRRISYQRNGEYKRYRIPEEQRQSHDPDVYSIFKSKVEKDIASMRDYSAIVDHSLSSHVHYADSRSATKNGPDSVGPNSADIVITSPPYGDHQTTVAYGQFSQDPAIIAGRFGYDEMKQVDKAGLGGASGLDPLADLEHYSEVLTETLAMLRQTDGRSDDALDFFTDYYAVMEQVAKILKPGQPVAWVVANRTMSRVNIPTHLITRELCEHLGYSHLVTLPREIPTKTLPWENAPENIPDQKGELMAEENIVVMQSPS